MDAARAGLDTLTRAYEGLAEVQAAFSDIDRLCSECASLIDNNEKIKILSTANLNLKATLGHVEDLIALPQDALVAEEMLQEGKRLTDAYECLSVLELTSKMA